MIILDVPFKEKEQAKSLGARWNPLEKKWYIPEELESDTTPFQKWLPVQQIVQSSLDADATPANEQDKGITLSQLMYQVQSALRLSFPGAVWVKAEIANLNERRGHWYLELSETAESGQSIASCRAMIWQSQVQRILARFEQETGTPLKSGQKILLLAEVNFHEKFGFSLVIQDIDPSFTLGELEANLHKIRQQLIAEKLYDQNKQQLVPSDYFRVAVIAPPNAAGLGDFRADADMLQNAQLCEFKYFYSAFQGEQVENEMTAAFEAFEALNASNSFDALIIIRGGGAKLDLNPLNSYLIAKKIAETPIAVLTGIGHERDNTLLDEVAAVRFDTPSKVIAAIRQSIFQGAQKAQQNWFLIEKASQLYIHQQKQTLSQLEKTVQQQSLSITEKLKGRLAPLHYQIQRMSLSTIQKQKYALKEAQQTVQHQVQTHLNAQKHWLNQYIEQVKSEPYKKLSEARMNSKQWMGFILSSGPKVQLNRGFTLVKDPQGNPIKSAKVAQLKSHIKIVFHDGEIEAMPMENKP